MSSKFALPRRMGAMVAITRIVTNSPAAQVGKARSFYAEVPGLELVTEHG